MKVGLSLQAIFAALAICSSALGQPSAPHSQPFTLGIIVPLTGDLADYGTAIQNGFELAKRDNPGKYSNVRFVYEDSRYDGKVAVDALLKLRSLNKIDLYYMWGVSPTEALLPITAAQKIPVIAETTLKETTVGKPLVVRAARTGERIAKALAAELEKQGAKSVSFIVTEIPFYLDIIKHLEPALQAKGITVRRKQEILPDQSDFKSFLLDRAAVSGDFLGTFLLPSQLITFFRQADQAKLHLRAFNSDILGSDSIVKECPDNINGTFFTSVGLTPEFRKHYAQAYGNDNQLGSAGQAYDVASIVSDLFGNLDRQLSAEDIIGTLSKMPPRTGVTGSYRYSESPDGGKEIRMPVSMDVVRNKKIENVTEDTGF